MGGLGVERRTTLTVGKPMGVWRDGPAYFPAENTTGMRHCTIAQLGGVRSSNGSVNHLILASST